MCQSQMQSADTVHGEIKYMTLLFQIVANVFGDIGVILNNQYPQGAMIIFNSQVDIP